MKAIEQYFTVGLFIMLYKVDLDFVDEILKCAHSNESYQAALYCGAVHFFKFLQLRKLANLHSWEATSGY